MASCNLRTWTDGMLPNYCKVGEPVRKWLDSGFGLKASTELVSVRLFISELSPIALFLPVIVLLSWGSIYPAVSFESFRISIGGLIF